MHVGIFVQIVVIKGLNTATQDSDILEAMSPNRKYKLTPAFQQAMSCTSIRRHFSEIYNLMLSSYNHVLELTAVANATHYVSASNTRLTLFR